MAMDIDMSKYNAIFDFEKPTSGADFSDTDFHMLKNNKNKKFAETKKGPSTEGPNE